MQSEALMFVLAVLLTALPPALFAFLLWQAIDAALEDWQQPMSQDDRAMLYITQQSVGAEFLARQRQLEKDNT